MGFVKIVKNKAYFKRYQVQFRRRRENKTDYYARQRLIIQDKNKYKAPKYRLVVRKTKRDIICQVFAADLTHDVCIQAAYSHELSRFGLKAGFKNYAAAYATGLLLARRINSKFKLDYEGVGEEGASGEPYLVKESGEKRPFKCVLDVGLQRTTTGARLFGALKGALDGGLLVPHNDRRFPGTEEGDELVPNPETHRKYIFAGHVADYMRELEEKNEKVYKKRFSRYLAAEINADGLEDMYTNVHKAIRKDPFVKRAPLDKGYFAGQRKQPKLPKDKYPKKRFGATRMSASQRYNRIVQKLKKIKAPIFNELVK